MIARFLRDERGATAIEYAMIAGTIAMGIIVGVGLIGGKLTGIFQSVAAGFG